MTDTSDSDFARAADQLAPYPGSRRIPRWQLGDLPEAPAFTWKNWLALIGPGFLMGALAIGGGEWLMGPIITARFGAGLLWLALIALLCQLIYNIEISRYTLYTGEPIFTGKFRTLPGPQMWVWIYLLQAVKLPDGYRFRDSTVSIRKEGEFCSQSNPTLGPLDFLKTFASTTQRSLVHRKAKHHPPRRLIPRRRHAVFAGYQHVHRRDNA